MTFSIVARSADGESWGVAVASKFLAVGSAVPAAVAGVGAIATQADANVAYKGLALAHLDEGATASVALQRLLEEDDGRDDRQVGIVDVDGGAATHTGHACLDWAGGVTGDGVRDPGQHPGRRGGRRGDGGRLGRERRRRSRWPAGCSRRSRPATTPAATAAAASRRRCSWSREGAGYGGLDDIAVDLRVDDHADPVTELARLLDLNDLYLTASTEEEQVADHRRAARPSSTSCAHARGTTTSTPGSARENYEMRVDAATAPGSTSRCSTILRDATDDA